MLKISNLKLGANVPENEYRRSLIEASAAVLSVKKSDITSLEILKMSVDSRKKPNVLKTFTVVVSVKNENEALKHSKKEQVSAYVEKKYEFNYTNVKTSIPIVVVGSGPAGLFAALMLAEAGAKCILLERGRDVDRRVEDVRLFREKGVLNTSSNIQFGEGGAGTFSDGKLTTGVNDERIPYVLNRFVEFGAPEDILYLSKPHIGTDRLRDVVKNMRLRLERLGCSVRFEHCMMGIVTENGALSGIEVSSPDGKYTIDTNTLILAPGNSARDTFRMLHAAGAAMEPKAFAVGVRIEHKQRDIDLAQYGEAATLGTLPASDYKLAVHLENGRGVFTFCVCPGGEVVAAASEEGGVVTNGMSEYRRDGENINGGLLVSITNDDFDGLFGGMEFQRKLEVKAFEAGGRTYCAPAQTVGDFLARRSSAESNYVNPTYTPGVVWTNLWDVLPTFICESIEQALPLMDRKVRGFASENAVLTAVETRSSCPVRILRNSDFMSTISGVFPCGEGAGYAGGITTSAVDGIRCAEAVCAHIVGR